VSGFQAGTRVGPPEGGHYRRLELPPPLARRWAEDRRADRPSRLCSAASSTALPRPVQLHDPHHRYVERWRRAGAPDRRSRGLADRSGVDQVLANRSFICTCIWGADPDPTLSNESADNSNVTGVSACGPNRQS